MRTLKLYGLVFLLSITNLFAQQKEPDLSVVREEMDQLVANGALKSVSVSISRGGKTVYSAAVGTARQGDSGTATPFTPYQIASVTKPFTATGIMLLASQNKIDIDDPFTTYLPDYNIKKVDSTYHTPTIRELLSHTAGLGTYFYVTPEHEKQISFEDSWKHFGTQFEEPGTVYEYSNLGYALLSEIIEEVSGLSYAQFMKKEIFQALEMKNSFVIDPQEDYSNTAVKSINDKFIDGELYNNTEGAGNIYSTTEDLLKFGNFHLGLTNEFPALSEEQLMQMHTYKNPDVFYHYYKDTFYGLGWYASSDNSGSPIYWHEGGTAGASAMLFIVPDREIVISITSNTFNSAIMQQLTKTALSEFGVKLNEGIFNPIANYKDIAANSELIGKWSGSLQIGETDIPVDLLIEEDDIYFNYLDHTVVSHTMPQPLFIKTGFLFMMVNNNRIIGSVVGNLPKGELPESRNLLNIKFIKEGNKLKGFLTAFPLGGELHYAFPYYLELTKSQN
ncbi:serine hydrolase [Gramella sp. KN1008]|uniref:serine hydrolase domain-containing protein n=1 Tax=Gramella sp. KN1008 TaxID=2529298 RepID=UPI00103AD956|nr:serine hydrolase domain-containing protein [Gramella sp. KN1008]TBW25892.1 class A beta-lactamase-related serine hydrolase [Gramella sp. KN1008]